MEFPRHDVPAALQARRVCPGGEMQTGSLHGQPVTIVSNIRANINEILLNFRRKLHAPAAARGIEKFRPVCYNIKSIYQSRRDKEK